MPSTIVFRPIEAKFKIDDHTLSQMDPYCKITIGHHSGKTHAAKPEGNHAHWSDYIGVEATPDNQLAIFKIKDKAALGLGKKLGEAKIDLEYVINNKKVVRWYDIYDKDNNVTGEVLLEAEYMPPM